MGKIAPKVMAALRQADDEEDLTYDRGTRQLLPKVKPRRLEVSPALPEYEPAELSQDIFD